MTDLVARIKSKKKVLGVLVLVFIVLTIPVVLLVDDFVKDVILVPFAYYFWLGKIIIKALPQSYFLTLFIVMSLLIALPSLKKGRRTIWKSQPTTETIEGQVGMWEQRLRLLAKGSYSSNRFAYHLGHLVVQILAYQERLTTREVITGLENKTFVIPVQVRQYVLKGIGNEYDSKRIPLLKRIKTWWDKLNTSEEKKLRTDQNENILLVMQYIEDKLKISDG